MNSPQSSDVSSDAAAQKNRPRISLARWLLRLFLLGLIVFLVSLILRPRLYVTVRNAGPQQLQDLRLIVTGSETSLGDFPAGHERTGVVSAKSDSHLSVEFTDSAGKITLLEAGGYFGPGSTGEIRVEIENGQISSFEDGSRL